MATHSSILAWEIPCAEKSGGLQTRGVTKSQIQLNTQAWKIEIHFWQEVHP